MKPTKFLCSNAKDFCCGKANKLTMKGVIRAICKKEAKIEIKEQLVEDK